MSLRRALILLTSLAVLVPAVSAAQPAPAVPPSARQPDAGDAKTRPSIETGPAIGWVFPVFTDKEGYHLLTLRGSAARVISTARIDVTDFSAFAFSGDAAENVETVLLSSQASFFPKENRATGESNVRLIHDDIEVNGRGWTYEHGPKKVSLRHDVRVTFNAQLNDILK